MSDSWQTVQSQERGVQTSVSLLWNLSLLLQHIPHQPAETSVRLLPGAQVVHLHSRYSFQGIGYPIRHGTGHPSPPEAVGITGDDSLFSRRHPKGCILCPWKKGNLTPPSSPSCLFIPDTPVPPSTYREIDESKTVLSISTIWQTDTQTMRELWPFAAQGGLTPGHLQQLEKAFRRPGLGRRGVVALTLRYLDWQLEHGGITDQKGNLCRTHRLLAVLYET